MASKFMAPGTSKPPVTRQLRRRTDQVEVGVCLGFSGGSQGDDVVFSVGFFVGHMEEVERKGCYFTFPTLKDFLGKDDATMWKTSQLKALKAKRGCKSMFST